MNNIHLLTNQDIFRHPAQVILHQANCFTTMGSGIAASIRGLYPEAYEADCRTIKGDSKKLGTFSWAKTKRDNKIIINMYSQYNYGRESRKTNYEAFANGLERVRDFLLEKKLTSLSIPYKIGCNLGGGNWNVVKTIIYETLSNQPFDVFICKKDEGYDVDVHSIKAQTETVLNKILNVSHDGHNSGCLFCGQINEIVDNAKQNLGNECVLREMGIEKFI